MEGNKEILELLTKIEKSNRQQMWMGRIMCVLALVTAVSCIVVFSMLSDIIPQINSMLPQISTIAEQARTVLGNLEEATEQLASADLESMVTNVDALVVTGQQSLEQTMEKLNGIDFDALNQAIEDLADVIEPLAKFFNAFR